MRHQRRATINAVRQGNHLFFMDPGVGKTKAALDAVAIQSLKGKCRRLLVVTTLDGIGVWEDEIDIHYPFRARVCSIGGAAMYRGNPYPSSGPIIQIFLLNYDQYRKRSRHEKGKWVYPVSQALEAWSPDMIIFDESHRLKRAGGVTAQLAWRSVGRMRKARRDGQPFVYELTGTPNPKGWIDLFAQLRVMDSSIFGTSKASFEEKYCTYGQGSRRYTIVKYRGVSEIKKKVRDHATIISKQKALDLPPQVWQNVPVVLPTKARRAYDEMAEEFVTEVDGHRISAANAGARRIRLLQITGGFTTNGQIIHRAKLLGVESLAIDLLQAEMPLVVYARFLAEVGQVTELLEKLGYRSHAIMGSVSRSTRHSLRREFQQSLRHKAPMALVFQVATGSETITLTAANEVLFYSLPDGWKDYWQCLARTHRKGQQQRVRYRHLVARGTLDYSVLRNLRRKSDMHADLMRNPQGFLFGA